MGSRDSFGGGITTHHLGLPQLPGRRSRSNSTNAPTRSLARRLASRAPVLQLAVFTPNARRAAVFPLAMRAGAAGRAAAFHPAMRAGVAVRAVAFHFAMRAGVAVRTPGFLPSVRAPLPTHRARPSPRATDCARRYDEISSSRGCSSRPRETLPAVTLFLSRLNREFNSNISCVVTKT